MSDHPPKRHDELRGRSVEILDAIVKDFIATGEPVGSQSIAPRCEVSPATVRSVMADLEEQGYLEKPHTSAGRVPTDRAYRLYVDSLVKIRHPSPREVERIDRTLAPPGGALDELIPNAGRVLSELSHHAAVIVAPGFEKTVLSRIEFVKLREDRVLAVLVTSAGLVQNRLIALDFPVGREELEQAANRLTELLGTGASLDQLLVRMRAELTEERTAYDALSRKIRELGERAAAPTEQQQRVVVAGEQSFLDEPAFIADVTRMKKLFQDLAQKDRLLQVLVRAADSREVTIFIGAESEFSGSAGISLVAAPYQTPDGVTGALAVIGPTRMNYGRVIALVEYTARAVSRTLDI